MLGVAFIYSDHKLDSTIPDVLGSLCDDAIWFLSEDHKAEPSFMLVGQQKFWAFDTQDWSCKAKYTGK